VYIALDDTIRKLDEMIRSAYWSQVLNATVINVHAFNLMGH
jgi:hypothetical protein